MNDKDFKEVLGRVDELKALFHFVQRVIPLLEYLFHFLRDLLPVLEGINVSIKESSSKIPHASNKLNKVTEANELATTEILNIVERMIEKTNNLNARFTAIAATEEKRKALRDRITGLLNGGPGSDPTASFASVRSAWQEYAALPLYTDEIEAVGGITAEMINDATNIMMALQVQDITAQQIAAVNHLIESVQLRLSTLLGQFDQTDFQNLVHDHQVQLERATFDPNATYSHDGARQKLADRVVEQHTTGELDTGDNVVASQDEVDKMFMK